MLFRFMKPVQGSSDSCPLWTTSWEMLYTSKLLSSHGGHEFCANRGMDRPTNWGYTPPYMEKAGRTECTCYCSRSWTRLASAASSNNVHIRSPALSQLGNSRKTRSIAPEQLICQLLQQRNALFGPRIESRVSSVLVGNVACMGWWGRAELTRRSAGSVLCPDSLKRRRKLIQHGYELRPYGSSD